jgi:FkbM family methyltransferase
MKKIYQFADPIRGVEGRHGLMLYNQYDQYIGKSLELYGEYCQHEIYLFQKIIKKSDVVWEIGANTGSQAPALSKLVAEGRYLGFEPQIELFKILSSNLSLNGCENAFPLCFALGDEDGIIELPSLDYHQAFNFGAISMNGEGRGSRYQVEIRRIDSLGWLPPPNFMKIDVEGMEVKVVQGGRETIEKHRPIIYIENDRVENSEILIQLLWDLGYRLYWHISNYYNQHNYFNNALNVFPQISSFNMLCIPTKSDINIEGEEITDKTHHPLKK